MSRKIEIDPLTRLEGHYAIRLEVDSGRVVNAFSSGEMFRGFEVLLRGRSPLDAQQITQRICGVCPISHGMASVFAQEEAYNIRPPRNGRLMRNLMLAANYIQSHIIHFYQLSALDFIDITAVKDYSGHDPALTDLREWVKAELASNTIQPAAPFLPRYAGRYVEDKDLNLGALRHYLDALEMRALAHRMVAVFGGKAPHAATLVPGGLTERVTARKIAALSAMIQKIQAFIDTAYLPDVLAVARAFRNTLKWDQAAGTFWPMAFSRKATRAGTIFSRAASFGTAASRTWTRP